MIVKNFLNAFRETSLDDLKQADVDQVTICGAMSHMCIDASTRAASDLGFKCSLIHDACATRDVEFGGDTIPAAAVQGSFMSARAWGYACTVSCDEYIAHTQSDDTQT